MQTTKTTNVIDTLSALVAIDTRNPPRRSDAMVAWLREHLSTDFELRITDLGDGAAAILASRGTPKVVFNVHVDTVPVVPGWQRNPLAATIEGDRIYGLGTADTKGAAAALIAAAKSCDDPVALLFTTDEEAGEARCARWFAAEPRGFSAVVVAEPTGNQAVLAHRGVGSARLTFKGEAGHSSAAGSVSANHELVKWAARALKFADERREAGLDIRLNLGRIDGGEKPNVVAASAEVRFGVRPPPGTSPADVLRALIELAPNTATSAVSFVGEPLPALMHRETAARRLANAWGVPLGEPVDFWTEAAIFSAVMPAFVYGPGSIRQAHAADEFLAIASLSRAVVDYRGAFRALEAAVN